MKYGTLKTVATLGLFLILAVVSVSAQSGSWIAASIPFDFAAGETKLKAGDYTVKRLSKETILLRSADQKTNVIVLASVSLQQARGDARERLVFNRYGSEYFLTQVWTNRNADGRELSRSKTETRLAKSAPQPEAVEIIARGQ